MRRIPPAVFALLAFSTLIPAPAHARIRPLIERPVRVEAVSLQMFPALVSAGMANARLGGHLVASGGTGNDIQVFVFRQPDYVNWSNGHNASVLFKSDRQTIVDLDLALPPDNYVVVLSNKFSSFTPKTVSGSLTLAWDEDPSLSSGVALKQTVAFHTFLPDAGRLEVPIRGPGGSGRVTFQRDAGAAGGPWTITIRRPQGKTSLERVIGTYALWIEEVGTVDVDNDKFDDVYFVGTEAGSGAGTRELTLLSTSKLALISLSLHESFQATADKPEVTYSENFTDARFAAEQSFLERMKEAYIQSGSDDDPARIFAVWAKDNDGVTDGPLTIRRYPGKSHDFGSTMAVLSEGPVTYTAHFKAGVIAYDTTANEHYALFHPKDMYAWPTVLKRLGPYLIIGTRGEGLAIIDTRKFTLKRIDLGSTANDVESVAIVGSKIRVNGTRDIDAPAY